MTPSYRRLLAMTCGFMVGLNACSGSDAAAPPSSQTPTPPAPEAVASVAITGTPASLQYGQSAQLTAVPSGASGAALTGRTVTWSSSNAAIATISSSGAITAGAVRGGTAESVTFTATVEQKSASVTVAVSPIAVATVNLSPSSATVTVGQTVQLTATLGDMTGATLSGRAVTWTSQNPALATVNAQGLVTAVAPGSVVITAASGSVQGTTAITVNPEPVANVMINGAPTGLQYEQTVQLTATATSASGAVLTGRPVSWSSSNAAIATISAAGVITGGAVRGGTAESVTFTATVEQKSATVTVPIAPIPVATVVVSPSSSALTVGQTVQLSAALRDVTGATLSGRPVTWTSQNPALAAVSAQGLVTAVAPGAVTITAASGSVLGTATITSSPPPALRVTLSQDSVVLDTWGDTASIGVTVRNQAGVVQTSATVQWESLDPTVASVSSSGVLTSLTVGSTRLRVTASAPGSTSGSAEIPVRVAFQRNLACRVPTAPSRGASRGAPSYGTTPRFLSDIPVATWPGVRPLPVDYDGDGDTDLLRLEYMFPSSPGPYRAGIIKLYRNERTGFTDVSSTVLSAPNGPDHARDFEIRDFTGDGVEDVYVAVHGYDASPFPGAPNLFFSRSGSRFAEMASSVFAPYQTNGFTHGTTSADVDCDGDLDIVEIQANDNVPSNLFLNSGSGRFTLAPSGAFPLATGIQLYQEGEFIDFDSDGDPDLYVGCKSTTLCTSDIVLVNDGFGRFHRGSGIVLPAPGYAPTHALNQAKAVDLNGDGWMDLVTYEIDRPFTTTSKIRIWTNQRNGRFSDQSVSWNLPASCSVEMIEPLYVRDMNVDGWPDLVLREQCPELGRSSGILFNRGTRFEFFASTNIVSWLLYDEITPADVDGDGKLDLLYASRGGDVVWVRQP